MFWPFRTIGSSTAATRVWRSFMVLFDLYHRCFSELNKKRQDNSSNRKQGHTSSILQRQKSALSLFGEITALRVRRHSAVQCWPRVVRMPWYLCHGILTWAPAVGQPVGVRWVPRSTQKKEHSCHHTPIDKDWWRNKYCSISAKRS